MTTSVLDKTVTVSLRQLWRWTRRTLYIALPVYLALVVTNEWNLKMGGVTWRTSPFKDRIPEACLKFVDGRSKGSRSSFDNMLLRERISRGDIKYLLIGADLSTPCFGFAILAGLHGHAPGDANFTDQWVDFRGDPVVTVRVQYHQTLSQINAKEGKQ